MTISEEDIVVVKQSDFLDPEQYKKLKSVLEIPIVKQSLDKGAWIAGGFGRNILLKKDIEQYLVGIIPELKFPEGDIDIYYPNPETAQEMADLANAIPKAYRIKKTEYSQTFSQTFCHNFNKNLGYGTSNVTIQIIHKNELIFAGGLIECFESFDFYNVMVAIDNDNIYYHKLIPELEREKKLKINSNISPMLGYRINKYLTKGLEGITKDSEEKFKEWIFMAAFSNFKQFFTKMKITNFTYEKTLINHYVSKFKNLIGLIEEKDRKSLISIFVGKFESLIQEEYGTYVSVDWATHEINKIKNK